MREAVRQDVGAPAHHSESDDDTAHIVRVAPMTDVRRRSTESVAALVDAAFGARGLPGNAESVSWSATFASGVYTSETVPTLLRGPIWTEFSVEPPSGWIESVVLDLRTGVVRHLMHQETERDEVEIMRFLSAGDGGVAVQVITGPRQNVRMKGPLLRPPTDLGVEVDTRRTTVRGVELMTISEPVTGDGIAVAAHDEVTDTHERRTITRVVGLAAGDARHVETTALHRLDEARRRGRSEVERRHRHAWTQRWERCGTWIERRPGLERSIRFATFHLLCAGSTAAERSALTPESDRDIGDGATEPVDDVAIGARGLTGWSYRGHVFWDTDVFAVPALTAIDPDGARRALNYRWARLAPARARAATEGRRGARFPWESAGTGDEVTPRSGRDLAGNPTTIRTGDLEEHITADIAWAVGNHVDWTGDDAFLRERGIDIFVATARYWASRIEIDDDGSGHIRNVIGPDEYHEGVDDNTFTNVMARHNLLRSASVAERFGVCTETEVRAWRQLAEAIVDGFDSETGVYEQFWGFHDLTPTLVSSIGEAPLPADAVLGHDGVSATQILKQPDVLMAYHLVPDLMHAPALEANLDHYGPRTAHGSSLSPAIMASLLFRTRRWEQAMEMFELAAALDLEDITGTTAGGIHLATMGGLWQAVTCGMLGLRPAEVGLTVDPRVPPGLGPVRHRVIFRGSPLTVTVDGDGDRARIDSPAPLNLNVGGEGRLASRHRLAATSTGWEHR